MSQNPALQTKQECRQAWLYIVAVMISLVGLVLLSPVQAWADIYIYRDKTGVVHCTNTPTPPRCRIHPLFKSRTRPKAQPRVRPYSRAYLKDSVSYDRLIRNAALRHNVEFALVKAVIKAESAFNPNALSSAGARGLMQLMPATAALHGVTDLESPRENIEGGVRHLRYLLDHFHGNIPLVLAAYNAGEGAVAQHKGIPRYKETQQYVQRALRYRTAYQQRRLALVKHSRTR